MLVKLCKDCKEPVSSMQANKSLGCFEVVLCALCLDCEIDAYNRITSEQEVKPFILEIAECKRGYEIELTVGYGTTYRTCTTSESVKRTLEFVLQS